MTRQTGRTAKWDWGKQLIRPLEKIVERVAAYDPDDETSDFEEMLLEPLSISGGESFTAEDHRGREILELLQNAQDAAGGLYEPESDPEIGSRGVYIGISDNGLLVANTGDSFDFSKPDRRKSLRILGHSETGEETIGQFGVGLTSIRSMGEAYEVWTKAPDHTTPLESQDCWRVFCGPMTTLAAIASAVPDARGTGPGDTAYQRFCETVLDDSEFLKVATETNPLESVPLSADQIPYFTYPVAMRSWDQASESHADGSAYHPLRERATTLLTNGAATGVDVTKCPTEIQSLLSDVGPFTTAVFVDYEDADWRALFEAITGTQPAPSDQNPAARLEDQAWFDNSDTDRVTPELLLNLGHIDRLVVERFGDKPNDPSSIQSWEVFGRQRVDHAADTDLPIAGREIRHGSGSDEVTVKEVGVQLKTTSTHDHLETPVGAEPTTYTFWDAKFTDRQTYDDYEWFNPPKSDDGAGDESVGANDDDGAEIEISQQDIEVSLLVQTATSDGASELYAPHLYYPISGAENQFPYCIHGDFVVQQNRQSLAGSGLERNCVVAAEAARLIGHLSEALATAENISQKGRAAIPWRLLPTPLDVPETGNDWPTAEEVAAKSAGQVADNEPLRVLRAAIYRRLRHHKNIQVVSEDNPQQSLTTPAESPHNVLLHHDPTVLAGIAALAPLVTHTDADLDPTQVLQRADAAVDISLPTDSTLNALLRWLVDGQLPAADINRGILADRSSSDQDRHIADLLRNVQDGVTTNRDTRLSQLVTGEETATNLATELLAPWWTVLQTWTECINDQTTVGYVISEVPRATGQAVLEATVRLGENDDSFPEGETYTPATEGPYLLPCDPLVQARKSEDAVPEHTTSHIQLVRVESHETRGDHQRQVLRPDNENIDEITPPEKTNFSLYLVSKTASAKGREIIKNANWGTREYNGAADLYRTLLRDIATRPSDVSMPDLRYLSTVYNRINFDSQTAALDAVEGGYHPHEQIKKLAKSRATVDNLKPRVNVRDVELPAILLDRDKPAHARTVRFAADLLPHWLRNHIETPDDMTPPLTEVDDADVDNSPPIRTDGPMAQLPSVEDKTTTGLSPSDIATQLGMLGVSVLPGVQTLLIRGDDAHPDRQHVSSWNPTTWKTEQNTRLQALQTALDTDHGQRYLDLLKTPLFGPGVSAGHTRKCSVKEYPDGEALSDFDVMLTSWVWLSAETYDDLTASDLVRLFSQYGESLSDSLLETGWNCSESGSYIREIETFVPTLLNWQLRTVSGWEDVEWFHSPAIEGLWKEHDEWGLQYAVLEKNIDERSTAASVFPRVDPEESPIAESVWRTLGVKELDNLNATEAAMRLNALIAGARAPDVDLGTGAGDEDRNVTNSAPELPGFAAIEAWQSLYGTLLGIIGTEVHERSDGMTLENLQFLDRVPAQTSDGTWVGLSCDALDTAVYYDSTESDWENRLARLDDSPGETDTINGDTISDAKASPNRYLLPRPASRYIKEAEFDALWKATEATQQPAQYPEIDRSKTTESDGDQLQTKLRNPDIKYGVLAAAPGKEAQTEHRNQYETIIETLRRIDPQNTDSDDRETAWRVTPIRDQSGLELENVTEDSKYAVAYDPDIVTPTEPVALADLFMALYGGGNKDSYKLALLGRNVKGKETVREELRATDVQELETTLRLAAVLLDSAITIETGMLTISDDLAVRDLRKTIARCLDAGGPLPEDTADSLNESVTRAINKMCATDSDTFRTWAGKLIRSANTRTDTLQSILNIDTPQEPPTEQQLTALNRLEETLPAYRSTTRLPAFNQLLPSGHPQRVVKTLHGVITGIQQISHRQNPNDWELTKLQEHSKSLEWAGDIFSIEEPGDFIGFDSNTDSLTAIGHDDITWFHLAWWLATAEQPPMETPPAKALVELVADFLDEDRDECRNELLEMARQNHSSTSRSRTGERSSGDDYIESDNMTLFDQMAADHDNWETDGDGADSEQSNGSDIEYSATFTSLDSSSSSSGSGTAGEDGPIKQTGDHPRVAELNVLQRSYEALYEANLTLETIQTQLAAMRQDYHNYWRPEDGWTNHDIFAADTLPASDELGQPGMEFPTEAFDITDEGEAGYDILDLTGWAIRQADDVSVPSEGVELGPYENANTLTPVPIEVKSVDPDRPSFKFSLNQYQRAYQFVTPVGEGGSVPYVLCLVDVNETDGDPKYNVDLYDSIIITCPADLRQLLPAELSPNKNEDLIDRLILETIYGGDLMISG